MKRLNCPLCRSEKGKFFERYKRWSDLNIYICKNCGFVYSELVPDGLGVLEAQQEFNYSSDIFDKDKYLFSILLRSKTQKGQRYKQILIEMKRIFDKFNLKYSSILDVGCSTGAFLDYVNKFDKSIITYGVDVYSDICKFTNKRHIVFCGFLENIKYYYDKKFDIISYLEVFEHLPEPHKELEIIKKILNYKGLLVLELPNLYYSYIKGNIEKSLLFKKFFKMEEWGLMPHIHYNHFSPGVIKKFLSKAGFKVVKIVPATHIRNIKSDINSSLYSFIYSLYSIYSIFALIFFKLTRIIISCNFIVFAIKIRK